MSAVHPSPDGRVRPSNAGAVVGRSHSPARLDPPGEPPPRSRVRRNRVWMVLLLLTPLCLGVISLITFASGGPPERTVTPRVTPAGYDAVTDAYFGYAVPDAYQQNVAWTDQNADFFYGDARAFVAETELVTKKSPTGATAPPPSFESFGEPDPVAFSVHAGRSLRVPGAAFAFEETITRPGGYHAVAVDTWERGTSTQMWMLLRAPAPVIRAVIASLRG